MSPKARIRPRDIDGRAATLLLHVVGSWGAKESVGRLRVEESVRKGASRVAAVGDIPTIGLTLRMSQESRVPHSMPRNHAIARATCDVGREGYADDAMYSHEMSTDALGQDALRTRFIENW